MSLQKRARMQGIYESVDVNVYDIATKNIVFTGSQQAAARFLGITQFNLAFYLKTKCRFKKKYAIRYKKSQP